jgi:UDP-glucose 4-epimerase
MVAAILRATGDADQEWARPEVHARRAGDPARVVASADRIHEGLGWKARYGLEDMVSSAVAGWDASAA